MVNQKLHTFLFFSDDAKLEKIYFKNNSWYECMFMQSVLHEYTTRKKAPIVLKNFPFEQNFFC